MKRKDYAIITAMVMGASLRHQQLLHKHNQIKALPQNTRTHQSRQ